MNSKSISIFFFFFITNINIIVELYINKFVLVNIKVILCLSGKACLDRYQDQLYIYDEIPLERTRQRPWYREQSTGAEWARGKPAGRQGHTGDVGRFTHSPGRPNPRFGTMCHSCRCEREEGGAKEEGGGEAKEEGGGEAKEEGGEAKEEEKVKMKEGEAKKRRRIWREKRRRRIEKTGDVEL